MMRALLLAGVVVGVACVSTPPTVHAEYQYALAPVPDPIAAGDTVQLTWRATPRDVPGTPPPEAVARVCVALIGPYADVAAAKASPGQPRACPVSVPGTMAATVATEVDLLVDRPATQSLVVPATLTPGLYNVWNVLVYGRTDNGNSATAAGIVRVTGRRP